MRLTWRQFETYLDAFKFCVREEHEKGREQNRIDDLETIAGNEELKEEKNAEVKRIHQKMQAHKDRVNKGIKKEEKLV